MSRPSSTPFDDLQDYVTLPRLTGLALSPDGTRLVTTVAAANTERNRLLPSLWQIDPTGRAPARRLTRGSTGESEPAFTPDGDLLFTSARPDPDAKEQPEDAPAALWRLPVSGEASVVGTRPGGVSGPKVARQAGTVVVTSMTLPEAASAAEDERLRTERRDRKVSAILHTGYPVRMWDHDLGPDQPRLLAGGPGVVDGDTGPGDGSGDEDREGDADGDHRDPATRPLPAADRIGWRDLTPTPGRSLVGGGYDITPDGSVVIAAWHVSDPGGSNRPLLVALDVATGQRRVLRDEPDADLAVVAVSPDGSRVAYLREAHSTPDRPIDLQLMLLALDGSGDGSGEPVEVAPGWDRWIAQLAWTPDGSALIVAADEGGRSPLFRIDLAGAGASGGAGAAGAGITRLTGDDGAYTDPVVSPDGRHVYALRNAVDAPPAPVRLDAAVPGQEPVRLLGPVTEPDLPGRLTEVHTTADDGTPLRSWLVLPHAAADGAPAPLLVWIHGGPLSSWNGWQWRWNPWLMAARGYAVLLPDPALSTGYGLDFVARGWGRWGAEPYTDVMALTDAAVARPDVDERRTAAMGGSFGGYMANWIAGHTDRFSAIVTHASLWALDQFWPTTDGAWYWRREASPEMVAAHSPHLFADRISTPMLVIHGDKDFRVPIGEALRLWWELVERHEGDQADLPHRFLYFPDENHWILRPQNSVTWYETVTEFLDRHVLGK